MSGESLMLLPCPFCGEAGDIYIKVLRDPDDLDWFAGCFKCDTFAVGCLTAEEAIKCWNRRTPDPELATVKEALSLARGVFTSLQEPTSGNYQSLAEYDKAICKIAKTALAVIDEARREKE